MLKRKKTERSPEHIIKLYDWLWRRANKGERPQMCQLNPKTLTGRCILLITSQMMPIHKLINSGAYRRAVLKIIHSN